MIAKILLVLCAAVWMATGAVISPPHALLVSSSQSTCACTKTVTQFVKQGLFARQVASCPPPTTTTITIIRAPPLATIVSEDPVSVASAFAFASQLDSLKHQDSSQDRPTGEPPETTPIYYTHTAYAPAVIGSDDPSDASVLYHEIDATSIPIATTIVAFAAEVTQALRLNMTHPSASVRTTTSTTYLSTVTITASRPATSSSNLQEIQKRQTCDLIYASISGKWASWCNEWNGFTTVKYPTYITTRLITHPHGGDPIPTSVWQSSPTTEGIVTIQTSLPKSSSSSTVETLSTSTPSSSSLTSEVSVVITDIVVTATAVVTYPFITVTQTMVMEALSSNTSQVVSETTPSSMSQAVPTPSQCGQVGDFVITFDDLPTFSTKHPDNETTAPPIFAPYSHFYWSKAFGYGPPPNEPFIPNDGYRLAEYNPLYELAVTNNTTQGRDLPGSFGAGPRSFTDVFWFDAKSVFIGCNNTGPYVPCEIIATGYRWIVSDAPNASKYDGHEEYAYSQHFTIPGPCVSKPCPLTPISFNADNFTGLSTLNFAASIGGTKTGFFLDTFKGAWTNNTCDAGLARSISRR